MTMDSGDYDDTSPPVTPPGMGMSRFKKRLSVHNLKLDVDRARRLSESAPVQFNETCPFASPECRTVTGGGDEDCACDSDIEQEGKDLFTNFVKEEIERGGLEQKAVALTPWIVATPIGYKNPTWAKAGRELREMADAFSRTKERRVVKDKACSMNVLEMTYYQFRDLMTELFVDHGITSERIVVLFLFCSDLALSNLEQATEDLFRRCIDWTWNFITEKICCWVKEHGGWRVVLSDSVQYMGPKVLGAFAAVGAMVAVYHFMKR